LNLIHLHGIEIANRFLAVYESLIGHQSVYHPYWDLIALIESLPGPPNVYAGWPVFGIHHLTREIMQRRLDELLVSVLAKV